MKCVGSVFVLQHLTGWLVKINWEREREQRDLTSAKESSRRVSTPRCELWLSAPRLRPPFPHPVSVLCVYLSSWPLLPNFICAALAYYASASIPMLQFSPPSSGFPHRPSQVDVSKTWLGPRRRIVLTAIIVKSRLWLPTCPAHL